MTDVAKSTLPDRPLNVSGNGQHLVALSSVEDDALGEERAGLGPRAQRRPGGLWIAESEGSVGSKAESRAGRATLQSGMSAKTPHTRSLHTRPDMGGSA